MTDQADWLPDGIDQEVASAARVYDYLLGGAHNFEVDRLLGEKGLSALPSARNVARLNRAFLRRAVLYLGGRGIRQFLDVGSGIPTVGNVHEVAQRQNPTAHVVYVDYEPVAYAHAQLALEGNARAVIVQGNMLKPEDVLRRATASGLLDLAEPVGLIMAGVFHFVPPEADGTSIVRAYREAMAPFSYLALSHFTADVNPGEMAGVVEVMSRSADPVHPRTHAEILRLFDGFDLVEPGLVGTAEWRPEDGGDAGGQPGANQIYAGVGRKR